MKTFILIMAILILGCEQPKEVMTPSNVTKRVTLDGYPYQTRHFKYDGHQYIGFSDSRGGVVHDPDCPCLRPFK